MRLAALVDSREHVCCRYRLRAFEPFLNASGYQITYFADPGSWTGRIGIARQLGEFDAVILQRRLPAYWESWLLRRHARRLVFDLDDAVWLRDSFSRKGFESRKRTNRFGLLMPRLDHYAAGNDYLSEACLKAKAPRGTIIPTCVDVEKYPAARHEGLKSMLAWIGSSSTLQGIEAMRPLWERLGKEIPNLVMKVICDRFPKFEHLPVIEIPWSEATERNELASADIGISWIPDDRWSRGKCGLKVLQSMAAGLPVVANRVGVHPEMITPGETGFLADTPDEWAWAIRTLAGDANLRRSMGQKAREVVRQKYSVERGAAEWLKVLDSLA
ncbi:glycosyltransferase family 4 protein [Zavarzinella formosa]|uniref:glycosyltransferase family 4 protein n=1 Tax=Zavarzinella formosa TaxID=360055 RepID=UPI00030F756B|nr:glycosyltransferase family 4 protein [Zavarzinella formosa]